MTAFPKRRRNWTILAAVTGVLVLASAPALGYAGWQVLKDSKAGTEVETLEEIAFPSTPTAMIAVVDDQNLVVALAVMVLSPSQGIGQPARGGTLVSIPTNANRAQTATEAALPVADSVINLGEEGLLTDVESLTRLTINYDAVLDVGALTSLLTPIGELSVSLPNDVVTATADGATETLFVAGATKLSPAEAANVLLARDAAQTESRRLPNLRAVWNGIAAAVGPGLDGGAVLTPDVIDFDDFMAHFLAGPVQVFNDIETRPITGSSNPDGLDIGNVDNTTMVLLMASLAPSAMITPNPTLNFRIENGATQADIDSSGLVGVTAADVTRDLVARLLFLSGNVVSVSSAVLTLESKVVPDITTVFTLDGGEPTELEAITNRLGTLQFEPLPFTFPLVQVVIVVGRTYLEDMREAQVAADSAPATSDGNDGSTDDTVSTDTGTGVADETSEPAANSAADATDTVTS